MQTTDLIKNELNYNLLWNRIHLKNVTYIYTKCHEINSSINIHNQLSYPLSKHTFCKKMLQWPDMYYKNISDAITWSYICIYLYILYIIRFTLITPAHIFGNNDIM